MPVTDAITSLHGVPATPSSIFQSTTAIYSDYELDFGAPAAGTSTPYLPEFPSSTEKGYTFPPEVVGDGGVEMGVHLVIGTAVSGGSISNGTINVYSSAASSATASIASRAFTTTQLAVAGAHYFVPVSMVAVLEFLRCGFTPGTGAAGAGTGWAWFGPKTGGEQ